MDGVREFIDVNEVQDFIEGRLYIDIYKAEEAQLHMLEEIVQLKWASGYHLWEPMEYTEFEREYMHVSENNARDGLCVYKTATPPRYSRKMTLAEFLKAPRTKIEISADDILEMYGS